jgi:hypothetical protein
VVVVINVVVVVGFIVVVVINVVVSLTVWAYSPVTMCLEFVEIFNTPTYSAFDNWNKNRANIKT